jgi:hypothetical protein
MLCLCIDHRVAVGAEENQIRIAVDIVARLVSATGSTRSLRDDMTLLADYRVGITGGLRRVYKCGITARTSITRQAPEDLAGVAADRHMVILACWPLRARLDLEGLGLVPGLESRSDATRIVQAGCTKRVNLLSARAWARPTRWYARPNLPRA